MVTHEKKGKTKMARSLDHHDISRAKVDKPIPRAKRYPMPKRADSTPPISLPRKNKNMAGLCPPPMSY